jgi:hypothetical protein
MRRRELFLLVLILVCTLVQNANGQSTNLDDHKFEIGGQFTLLTSSIVTQIDDRSVLCVTTPCPPPNIVFSRTRKTHPGFGGRFGYNLNSSVAIEGEVNFFPGADAFSEPEQFKDGLFVEGLFGVKAGKRFEKFGMFGTARPGFLHASKGNLEGNPLVGCPAIFPPPPACFQTTSMDNFAFDVGGVLEVYPSERTIIRIDAGDSIVRFGERHISTGFSRTGSIPRPAVWPLSAETSHNFQATVGVGFRF